MPSVAHPKYFVYILTLDRKGEYPFYVGKGSGRRPHEHLREAHNLTLTLKCGVIRYLLTCKLRYWIHQVHHTDDEQEAYWLEMKTITSFPHDRLCNSLAGRRPVEYAMTIKPQPRVPAWIGSIVHVPSKKEIAYSAHHQREVVQSTLVAQYDRHVVPPYFDRIGYPYFERW